MVMSSPRSPQPSAEKAKLAPSTATSPATSSAPKSAAEIALGRCMTAMLNATLMEGMTGPDIKKAFEASLATCHEARRLNPNSHEVQYAICSISYQMRGDYAGADRCSS
jgi:hypothetical protein